jgi:release factor glutamine methyltransferase
LTSPNIKNLLADARKRLADSPCAGIDAEVLLASALETTRSFLYANPELEPPHQRLVAFRRLVRQRAKGHPVAYLTGHCEFWSLQMKVSPSVLIPRPETELLVDAALAKIPPGAAFRIADLGTGSGAVALALASERRCCDIHATDISEAALKVAQDNAEALRLDCVSFHLGSWSEPLQGKFELIVSNPPYVGDGDPHLEEGDLRYEPRVALTPGADGLAAIREIVHGSKQLLAPNGWLMFEHGWEQGQEARRILKENGFANITTLQDLQGHERVTAGERA